MIKIVVTGSLAFDYIMDYPNTFAENIDLTKLHILNVSFLVDTFKKQKGGTAGNIAYSLALLQMPVSILGVAGEDFESYTKFLNQTGVETKNIKIVKDEATALVFIVTDKKDNQISAFYPGAMKSSASLSLKNLACDFCVISPNVPEVMVKLAKQCQGAQIPYLFDPGMQLPRLSDQDLKIGLKGAKILIGNDYEMGILKKRLKKNDQDLLQDVEILITTLGEKGSIIMTKNDSLTIAPAKPKQVSDPTGAGDAFRAGFLAGYLRGLPLEICGQMGAVAACYTVEKYGTTTHNFSLAEFVNRFKQNFHTKLNLKQ